MEPKQPRQIEHWDAVPRAMYHVDNPGGLEEEIVAIYRQRK
jgi:hypothetical protein